MRPQTLADLSSLAAALALVAVGGSFGCSAGPRMSPWGEAGKPRLVDYAVRPDLAAHLDAIAADAALQGLAPVARFEGAERPGGEPLVVVAYAGTDAIGRAVHAVRVASPWGIVLARGPLDLRDVRRTSPTELMGLARPGEAGQGDVPPPLTDLDGDGVADLVLRSEGGELEVWRVTARASTAAFVRLDVPATRMRDVDGDGVLDLEGRVVVASDDPIRPAFVDVAIRTRGGYSNRTDAARAFHESARVRARGDRARATSDAARLRGALEAAWHSVLMGRDQEAELRALDREPVPVELSSAFADHGRRIARVGR